MGLLVGVVGECIFLRVDRDGREEGVGRWEMSSRGGGSYRFTRLWGYGYCSLFRRTWTGFQGLGFTSIVGRKYVCWCEGRGGVRFFRRSDQFWSLLRMLGFCAMCNSFPFLGGLEVLFAGWRHACWCASRSVCCCDIELIWYIGTELKRLIYIKI